MSSLKTTSRLRRARRYRCDYLRDDKTFLSVHKTGKHIYAQIIQANNGATKVLAASSTLDKTIAKDLKYTCNIAAATKIGETIAKKALDIGIKELSFDRSGFPYHGKIKALAEAARKAGLKF